MNDSPATIPNKSPQKRQITGKATRIAGCDLEGAIARQLPDSTVGPEATEKDREWVGKTIAIKSKQMQTIYNLPKNFLTLKKYYFKKRQE